MTGRRRTVPPPSRDRWLLSYADFITLLFALFATLYAASTVDAGKLSGIAEGLQEAFADASTAVPGLSHTRQSSDLRVGGGGAASLRAAIERELGSDLAGHRLELTEDHRGLVLSIPEAGSFSAGKADMTPRAEEVMTRLAAALRRTPNAVRVEGHTDDVPIHTEQYTSNWELSTARATRVVELLVGQGVEPQRLSAAGYSEFHPRVANGSPDGRAHNRRVDVVILNADTRRSEEPAGGGVR